LAHAEIASTDGGDSMVCSGEAIPFVRLAEMLSSDGTRPNGAEYRAAVVLTSAAGKAAFGVRRAARTATVLVTSLPALTAADPIIAGASLDAEGNPLLVLDPDRLIAAAASMPVRHRDHAETVRAPILVIDDSLTTRMVVQGLLESAGHRVECAASGEDAFEKARQQRYSLFLVDVEMPGMDGYEFISQARGDPLLREIPSILVTSRNSQDDRRRGEEVGARAFIAKSEFNQGQFLETVRKLMG
jgi:two-component system chemotaxis sensor kinase CheA